MNHPKGTYLLIFTQMWERFSFYGMRTLLVLFMIESLHLEKIEAIEMYSLFITMVNLGGLAGGYCADRILGLKPSIFLGGGLIAIGHLCLILEREFFMFLLALSLIIVGTSLFNTNLKALVGQLYDKNKECRNAGYTLFYAGINCGGFFAAIACGYIAHVFGWHYGFGLAFIGMLIGLSGLFCYRHLLEDSSLARISHNISSEDEGDVGSDSLSIAREHYPTDKARAMESEDGLTHCSDLPRLCDKPGLRPIVYIFSVSLIVLFCIVILHMHHLFLLILPTIGCLCALLMLYRMRKYEAFRQILYLYCFIVFYIIFFMIEDLMGSFFMIFCENSVNRSINGYEIPSSTLVAINPLTVIICGTFLSAVQRGCTEGQHVLKMNSIAFLLLGIGFGVLYSGVYQFQAMLVPMPFVLVCFALIALGELFIAPSLYSFCSFIAPVHLKGQLMSLVIFGRAMASFLSGILSKAIILSSHGEAYIFGITAALGMLLSLLLAIIKRKTPPRDCRQIHNRLDSKLFSP